MRKSFPTLCLLLIIGLISWFCAITPSWNFTEVTNPDQRTEQQGFSVITNNSSINGNFSLQWMAPSRLYSLQRLRVRTWGCLDAWAVDGQALFVPETEKLRCNNKSGFILSVPDGLFSKDAVWKVQGHAAGQRYGVSLEKDWTEPVLIFALVLLFALVGAVLFYGLPLQDKKLRIIATLILTSGLFLRFYSVFILSPPQTNIESDMSLYFTRATEMLQGVYKLNQNFQPLGFVVESLSLRLWGGWELFNWFQVFVSWGTSLFIFLVALEYFGLLAAFISLVLATLHLPQLSFASFHLAECSYIFLVTLSLWWILKTLQTNKIWMFFVSGVLLMLSFYFKGTHAFFVPIFALWILFRKKNSTKQAWQQVAALAVGCCVVMIPQLMWTSYAYGKAMPGPSSGALNFVEGKCPWKDNRDIEGNSWMSPLFMQIGEIPLRKFWNRPFTDDAFFWKVGLECVQQNPSVMLTSVRYIYYLFLGNDPWPLSSHVKYAGIYESWTPFYYFVFLPLSLLGLILFYRQNREVSMIFILMMLSVFLMVYVFKSENRFRIPFDGILILWSGYALARIAKAAMGRGGLYQKTENPK